MFKVDGWNNFCRVFELPNLFSNKHCFGGGIDTNFKMVDWFYPVSDLPVPGCSKEVWREKVGEIETVEVDENWARTKLIPFLQDKAYIIPTNKYLVITDFGLTVMFQDQKKEVTDD